MHGISPLDEGAGGAGVEEAAVDARDRGARRAKEMVVVGTEVVDQVVTAATVVEVQVRQDAGLLQRSEAAIEGGALLAQAQPVAQLFSCEGALVVPELFENGSFETGQAEPTGMQRVGGAC